MKNINARINKSTFAAIGQRFGKGNGQPNPTGGAVYILESWVALHRRCLHDLKGAFSRGELMSMVDVMNGHIMTPQFAGQSIEMGLHDSIQLDRLDEKWDFDAVDFLQRIKSLSPDQLAHLEVWAKGYWETHPALTTGDDLEAYVSALLLP